VTIGHGPVSIVGAGPTGALLAIFLQRRGFKVTLYEGRPDPRGAEGGAGRSINLALADRGIHALRLAGVADEFAGEWVPMRGRLVHERDGSALLHLYGRRPSEVIYSVSRRRLNQILLDMATRRHGVTVKFEHRLQDVDLDQETAQILDLRQGRTLSIPMHPLLATDGAASLMRRRLAVSGIIDASELELDHGYKELSIPAGPHAGYRLAHDALHIWPRGNFMLIALPNTDGSFTATLFLSKRGAESFDSLRTPAAIASFLSRHFSDVYPLMPDSVTEFQTNPTGSMGTVHANPWHARGMTALIGDAAHAMVPFHGQGMNCCFEDCVEFDACLARNDAWETAFADFFAARKPNTDAIAAMALENYSEMRERVVDPKFRLQHTLALELERRHPRRFIPRYSMVMFHHEISYRTAEQRGLVQTRILSDLTLGATTLADIDYPRAEREISRYLAPISPE
jgi:kynurenine 3-monooxygenase